MTRLAAFLAPVALAGVLSACAYDPYATTAVNPYQGNAYASTYATPVPATVVQPYGPSYASPGPAYAAAPTYGAPAYTPGYATTVRPDPTGYCREAYANYADAQNRAAYSGNPIDVSRAQNTAGFYRRDC